MPISKIIAIGGGKVGRFSRNARTTPIDREIVRISGKKSPRLMFVPTASGESDAYCAAIHNQFGKRLGCTVDIMLLRHTDPDPESIAERMLRADIIYVGEGNTLRMMKTWRRYGVDKAMDAARQRGVVMCGSSAGSIAWFGWGNSDAMKTAEHPTKLIRVRGLGYINALICPHYDAEAHRKSSLKTMMKGRPEVAIALDEYCALVVLGDTYRVLAAARRRKAHRVYWKGGTYVQEQIAPSDEFKPLAPLLVK